MVQTFDVSFDQSAIPLMILTGILSVILLVLIIQLIVLQKRKKTNLLTLLLLLNLSWFISSTLYFIGMVTWYIEDKRTILFSISIPVGYSGLLLATYFILLFSLEIIRLEEKRKKRYQILYLIYISVLIFFIFDFNSNQWGAPPPIPPTRLILLIILLVGTCVTYIVLITVISRLIIRIEDLLFKNLLKFLLVFLLMSFGFYILAIVSEAHLMLIDNPPLYGPFEYAAYVSAIIALLYGDIGITQPEWFKKRFLKFE